MELAPHLGEKLLVDRPLLLLWLAASAAVAAGERQWHLYVGGLRIQPVGRSVRSYQIRSVTCYRYHVNLF